MWVCGSVSDFRFNFKIHEAVFGDCRSAQLNSKFSAALTSSLQIFADVIS